MVSDVDIYQILRNGLCGQKENIIGDKTCRSYSNVYEYFGVTLVTTCTSISFLFYRSSYSRTTGSVPFHLRS